MNPARLRGHAPRSAANSPHGQLPASAVRADNPQGRPLCPQSAVTPSFSPRLADREGEGGRGSGSGVGYAGGGEGRKEGGAEVWRVGVGFEGEEAHSCMSSSDRTSASVRLHLSLSSGRWRRNLFPVSFLSSWNKMMSRARRVRSFDCPSVRARVMLARRPLRSVDAIDPM